jgi:cyclophilin family peptidyl-prolyl cis-trans isomerase
MKLLSTTLLSLVCAFSAATLAVAQDKSAAAAGKPQVEMKTSMGTIVLELDPAAAPKTVENFLEYVKAGFFDGTIFHRVMKGFMIQGGGFDKAMTQKSTRAPIQNEAEVALKAGLKNDRGTIAMARTGNPHSATAQFFINHVNNDRLTYPSFDGWGYAVFGKVVSGMEVVDKIADVSVGNKAGHQNVPQSDVVIEKVTLKK